MRCAIDANRFDRLAKSLSSVAARRRVLQLLAALPFVGGLATLVDEDAADARGRRKRRKKRHQHGKGRHQQKKREKPCKAHSTAKTCAGKCGAVKNTCKKTVVCGSCDCSPACGTCFACQGAAGQPGACVPESDGTACGDAANCSGGAATAQGACDGSGTCVPGTPISCAPYALCDGNDCATSCVDDNGCVSGSFCNGVNRCAGDEPDGESCANGGQCQSGFCVDGVCCDGACDGACEACNLDGSVGACTTEDDGSTCGSGDICCTGECQECCSSGTCANPEPICDGGVCVGCGNSSNCVAAGVGDLCCAGSCATGVCCAHAECTSDEAPDCLDHDCVCVANSDAPCADGLTCCGAGCVNLQTNAQNCGACDEDCPGDQSCQGGVCGEVCGSDFCPAPDEICCNGACCDGCCGADGSCGACLVFVTSNVSQANLGGLAGADLACQTLAELATPAPLPGEYTAWLSIDDGPDQSPASGRFRHSGQPYRLVNGTQIAANWADLTDGNLAAPISLTEKGEGVSSESRFVWTNTRTDGTAGGHFGNGLLSCGGWQLTSGSSGNFGDATHTGVGWTFIGNGSCNTGNIRLYCFQQR